MFEFSIIVVVVVVVIVVVVIVVVIIKKEVYFDFDSEMDASDFDLARWRDTFLMFFLSCWLNQSMTADN